MNLQSARKSQVETALKNIKSGLEELKAEEFTEIQHFQLMSTLSRVKIVEEYIQDLEVDPEVEKMKTEYKQLKSKYEQLKQRYDNLKKRA